MSTLLSFFRGEMFLESLRRFAFLAYSLSTSGQGAGKYPAFGAAPRLPCQAQGVFCASAARGAHRSALARAPNCRSTFGGRAADVPGEPTSRRTAGTRRAKSKNLA